MKLLPFDYSVRNLGRSRTRLLLSVGGSALVVLLVIAAGAFVRGMAASIRATGSPGNVILLGAGSEESIERSEIPASTPGELEASLDGLRARAGATYISPEVHVQLPVAVEGGGPARPIMVRGITPSAVLVHDNVQILEGRLPSAAADEVMVGRMSGATLGLSDRQLAVGSRVLIDHKPWTVVGRFTAPGTVLDAEVWAPLRQLMSATRRETVSCAVATLEPGKAEFADVAVFVKTRPDLELSALPETQYYGRLAAFFGPIRAVAWITAGLIALGGIFGGLNTMYAAFASRIREIGTLQSLGFRRTAIVTSLVLESILATSVGALIGAGLGVAVLDGLAVRFSLGAFGLRVDAPVLAIGLAAGLILGAVGALPPAIRCLRLPIPAALKAA